MSFLFGRTKERPGDTGDRQRLLEGVPVLDRSVTLEDGEGAKVLLSVRFERGRGFLDRFRPPVDTRRINLDELGAFVVRLIDGKKTVKEIIHAFVVKHRINRREAELSVLDFLKSLIQRNVILIAIK